MRPVTSRSLSLTGSLGCEFRSKNVQITVRKINSQVWT